MTVSTVSSGAATTAGPTAAAASHGQGLGLSSDDNAVESKARSPRNASNASVKQQSRVMNAYFGTQTTRILVFQPREQELAWMHKWRGGFTRYVRSTQSSLAGWHAD